MISKLTKLYVKNEAGEVVDVQEAFQFIAFEPTPVAAANRFVWSTQEEELHGETIVLQDMESDVDLRLIACQCDDETQFKIYRIVCETIRVKSELYAQRQENQR
jgi:hypothetical protein